MNIFEMENMVKGLPDEILQRELASPSDPGRFPQWLTMSEVMRRKSMRESFQAKNAPQGTVKDQVMQEGIAAAMPQGPQGGPPMGPPPGPQGAPVAAYGGGRMPYRMADGGPVPTSGGYGPPSFYGSFGPELIGGPDRLQRQFGSTMKPPLLDYTDPTLGEAFKTMRDTPEDIPDAAYQQMFVNQFSGLRAPTGGAYGGGAGGGLEYGGPTNYFMPFSFSSMDRKKPTVTVEEIPETGMAGGGYIPGTVFMQAGQTVPRTTRAQKANDLRDQIQAAILQGAPKEQVDLLRNQLEMLTAPAPLSPQAQDYQTFQRIREAGVFPQLTTPALEMAAPDFSAQINAAIPQTTRGAAPEVAPAAAPAALPAVDTAAAVTGVPATPEVDMGSLFRQIRGNIGTGGGMTGNLAQAAKPFEQYFAIDQNAPALQATDFSPLIQQAEKRGAERAASYADTIKNIENEMKRERLGAVLTTLGANLMAGEGAAGLEKAGALAQQMGKEARQEIAAERRAARTAEEATSDRIFALNAQQLTSDKEAQRAIFNAQQGVKEKAFNALSKQMENQQQAAQAASQLAATLTVGAVNSMRDKIVTEGANARAVLDFAKEQARALKDTLGTTTVGMSATDIQKLVEDTLRSAIITGYAAIGQAPPKGFESQIRAAATAGGTGGTTAQSGSSRFDVQVVNPGR